MLIIDINEGSLCAALEYLCQLGISAASCLADTADKPLRAAHGPGSSGALWRVGHHGNARFHMQGGPRPAQSHLHSRCLREALRCHCCAPAFGGPGSRNSTLAALQVCNAAVLRPADFLEMEEEEWDDVMRVNLKGVFLVCLMQAAILTGPH